LIHEVKKEPDVRVEAPFPFLSIGRISGKSHIETEQINAAQSDDDVNEPGDPGHVTEYKGNQIKAEDTDKRPVQCTNYGNRKGRSVQKLIIHNSSFPRFLSAPI